MGRYGSLDDFKAALNGIVGQTSARPNAGRRKKVRRKKTRRNPRARRNMAIRKHGAEFDTVEELLAYEQAMGLGGPATAAPVDFGAAIRQQAPKRKARKPARGRKQARKPFTGELKDPSGPISWGQAKVIGKSIGGMAAYCPQYANQKVSHKQALTEMGLTKGAASAVIDAMKQAGVLRPHGGVETTPAQQAMARQILADVAGVVCPTAAASNPYFY